MNEQPKLRPKPDPATVAEIDQLNDEQRDILASVLADKPALSHKDALDQLKAAGL